MSREGGGFSPWRRLWARDVNSAPAIVWHYTTADALIKIMTYKKLWASDIHYLNDASENTRMKGLLLRRIADRFGSGAEPRLTQLQSEIRFWDSEMYRTFVACFSEEGDSLSQWRAYGTGYGYAIGFSSKQLAALCDRLTPLVQASQGLPHLVFGGVDYVREDRENEGIIVDEFIDALLQSLDTTPNLLPYSTIAFRHRAPFVKDAAFSTEAEWRLAGTIDSTDATDLKHRPGRSHLIPYIALELGKDLRDLIVEIRVGPGPNRDLDVKAVKDFTKAQHLNVEVTPTAIPFRNW
jgi:hypothetical protein